MTKQHKPKNIDEKKGIEKAVTKTIERADIGVSTNGVIKYSKVEKDEKGEILLDNENKPIKTTWVVDRAEARNISGFQPIINEVANMPDSRLQLAYQIVLTRRERAKTRKATTPENN